MTLTQLVDAFKIGRQVSGEDTTYLDLIQSKNDSNSIDIIGTNAEYFLDIIDNKRPKKERIAFYAGFMSRPIKIGKFIYETYMKK